MRIKKFIQQSTDAMTSSIKYVTDEHSEKIGFLTRYEELMAKLPCCEEDCDCTVEHFLEWSVNYYEWAVFIEYSTYLNVKDGRTEEIVKAEANEIRTLVCRALGTTIAKRQFNESSGTTHYRIDNTWADALGKHLYVKIQRASLAPQCELVPVRTRPLVTKFKIVCPDDRTTEEIEQVVID